MDYRRQFRFLPWLSAAAAAAAARPTSEPPSSRPDLQTSTSTQSQRPPFRPPGIAPVQAPRAQAQAPPPSTTRPTSPTRAASLPPSPSRRPTESKTSAPPSPGTTQLQVAESQTRLPSPAPTEPAVSSLAPSPSRPATQPRTSHPPSPARGTTQPRLSKITEPAPSTRETRASSLPPSPSRRAAQPRTSQPASPARATIQPQLSQITEPARPTPETRASSVPHSPQSGPRDLGTSLAASPATGAKAAGSPSRPAMGQKASSVSPSESRDSKPQATEEKAPKVQSPSSSASQLTGQNPSQSPSPSSIKMHKDQTVGAVPQPQSPSKQPETAKEESSKPASPKRPLPFQEEKKTAASPEESLNAQPRIEDKSKAKDESQPPLEKIQPEKVPITALLKLDEMRKGKVAPQRPVDEEKAKVSDGDRALQGTTPDASAKSRELPGSASEAGKLHQQKQEVTGRKKTWMTTGGEDKDIKIASATLQKDNKAGNENHKKHVTGPGEQTPLHKGIREDISSMVQKLTTGHKEPRTNEKPISVITLAGENRGASMQVGSESAKKDASVHIYRGYNLNPDESPDFTTDVEGSSRGRMPRDSMPEQDTTRQAYINSNLQGINNSIMFSSSVTERDPGVHLVFYETITEAPKSSTKAEVSDTRKDEFNITRAEKLTYEPTVRRRCLRGLFLESSESDIENPKKPRRHGCRYRCSGKGKEKEITVA